MPDPSTILSGNPAASAGQAALGLAQTVTGLINGAKANKIAKELGRTRPKREISPLYGENLSLAESELAGGMSNAAERAYKNQLDKSTAASLDAILKGGGSVNNVGEVFAAGEEGRQRLAMMTDQLRLNQINNVLKAREMSAEEADKNFIFNDWMPWADKSAANAEARRDAKAATWSGLQTFAGGASGMFGNKNSGNTGSGNASSSVLEGVLGGFNEGATGTGRTSYPPASVGMFNFNPLANNFELPGYMSDSDWLTGSHNMF